MEKYFVEGKSRIENEEKRKLKRSCFVPPKIIPKDQLERRQRIRHYNVKNIYSRTATAIFELIDRHDKKGKDTLIYNIPRYHRRSRAYSEIECADYITKQLEKANYKPILGRIGGGGLGIRISWKSIRTITHSQKSEKKIKKRLQETSKILTKYRKMASSGEKQLLLTAPPPSSLHNETLSIQKDEKSVDIKGLMFDYELLKQEKDTLISTIKDRDEKYGKRIEFLNEKISQHEHEIKAQKRSIEIKNEKIKKGYEEKLAKFKFQFDDREKLIKRLEKIIENLSSRSPHVDFSSINTHVLPEEKIKEKIQIDEYSDVSTPYINEKSKKGFEALFI